ncbi:hypothetical protein HZH68_013555 [Vespula germanica]|uniref:Uncharacterized protein n=1 Tax=Vespula germanica TaxID=30212 RepID=A0A834JDX8_VESGE|nr:hypothetical protein HZH68_013555 [Vespula germanica]
MIYDLVICYENGTGWLYPHHSQMHQRPKPRLLLPEVDDADDDDDDDDDDADDDDVDDDNNDGGSDVDGIGRRRRRRRRFSSRLDIDLV